MAPDGLGMIPEQVEARVVLCTKGSKGHGWVMLPGTAVVEHSLAGQGQQHFQPKAAALMWDEPWLRCTSEHAPAGCSQASWQAMRALEQQNLHVLSQHHAPFASCACWIAEQAPHLMLLLRQCQRALLEDLRQGSDCWLMEQASHNTRAAAMLLAWCAFDEAGAPGDPAGLSLAVRLCIALLGCHCFTAVSFSQ